MRRTCAAIRCVTRGRRASARHVSGLGTKQVIDYIKSIGVTSVELLDHTFINDSQLLERGLSNYWGYNSIGFRARPLRVRPRQQPARVREMVARFHDAGLEVILDVVFNHTAEAELRPTLSFKESTTRRTAWW
jgi:glycogen operon protein